MSPIAGGGRVWTCCAGFGCLCVARGRARCAAVQGLPSRLKRTKLVVVFYPLHLSISIIIALAVVSAASLIAQLAIIVILPVLAPVSVLAVSACDALHVGVMVAGQELPARQATFIQKMR